MTALLTADTSLRPTPWCMVRRQNGCYLFYNRSSDELYLLAPAGYFVYQLCNGLNTVSDIESHLAGAIDVDVEKISNALRVFITELMTRGIVEIACDE